MTQRSERAEREGGAAGVCAAERIAPGADRRGGWLLALALAAGLGAAPAAPVLAQEDYGRAGLYLGGSWMRAAENFDGDLDEELEEVLAFTSADADVDDFDAFGAVLGLRTSRHWSVELVGERYRELRIDVSAPGASARADVDLRAALLMTKLYVLSGPIQPYLMAGFGVIDARAQSGGLSDRGKSGIGRAGLGLDLYLTPNLVLGVQASYSQAATADFDEVGFFSVGGSALLRF